MINGIDVTSFKNHPRIAEIRFILLFDMFEKEYGYNTSIRIFEALCGSMNCNMRLLQDIINQRHNIKRYSKTKRTKWRQEVLFFAYLFGFSTYNVCKNFFNVTPMAIYNQKDLYNLENFVTDEWLRELDDEILVCGLSQYRLEVKRFIESLEQFEDLLRKWNGGK